MTSVYVVRDAVAQIAATVPQVAAAHPYRPASFNTSPLVYVDGPTIDRIAQGRGAGDKKVQVTLDVVLVVSNTWDSASQRLCDDLIPLLMDAYETSNGRTLGGLTDTTVSVETVRALTVAAAVEEAPPVGAVLTLRILTRL